jgi:serine/threonine-protein kinase
MAQETTTDQLVEQLCSDQRRRWKAGERVPAEKYFQEHPELLGQPACAVELIFNEFLLHQETGEAVDPRAYLRRFPQFAAQLQPVFEVDHVIDLGDWLGPPASPHPTPLPAIPAYEVLAELGQGGMGVVFKARQLSVQRLVALKVIRGGALARPEELARFRVEARALARMQHPHIVQIFEVGAWQGQPFFSMEWVDGGSLAAKLAGTPQPPQAAAQLVETLARALHAVHQQGILHRDLKPANVLMTEDGTLKVSDFGLAKRLGADPGASTVGTSTPSGAIVGTPCYMAPEQAQGKAEEIGPAADLYALGVILYEMLTGRPPFQGQTPLDTLQQVVSQEPVPPARLQPKVPRDLETICLKCLHKEPRKRYASAADLAEDLRRFQAGEPIRARPTGPLEHFVKWVKRKPTAAALWGVVIAAVLAGGAGWWWLERQEAGRREEVARLEGRDRHAIDTALEQAQLFLRQARWPDAEAALAQAAGRLAGYEDDELQERLRQARDNLRLAKRLDDIRLDRATIVDGKMNLRGTGQAYAAALQKHGIDALAGEEAELARRIMASPVKEQLVAALEDWAGVDRDGATRTRLLALARGADPNAERNRFRDPAVWQDRRRLAQLAGKAKVDRLSPPLLAILGNVLEEMAGPGVELLERGQRRYPGDFWLNFELANALSQKKRGRWQEAVGYYRAALAVRPQAVAVYNNLGNALQAQGDLAGAIASHRQAIAIDPKDAHAHNNLGTALQAQGDLAGAIAQYQEAIALDPKDAGAHNNLGIALKAKGNLAGAMAEYKQAIVLDPNYVPAHSNLGVALEAQGDLAGAIAEYKRAIAIDPKLARLNYNDPKLAKLHYNLGNALQTQGDLAGAIAEYKRAITIDPNDAKAHNNLGAALKAHGDLAGAIAEYRQATTLDPKHAGAHANLGQALLRQGRFTEAHAATGRALGLLPPTHPLRNGVTQQLRQCEQWQKLDAKLPAILNGDIKPADIGEQLALAQLCQQLKKRYAAAARFFACAFTANPKLADDLRRQHRYNAACAAALAAAGQGEDATPLDDKERARWRRQALAWLRADLALWAKHLDHATPQTCALVQGTLRHWQTDADLAGLRDPGAQAQLSEDEREACRKLWAEVKALWTRCLILSFLHNSLVPI